MAFFGWRQISLGFLVQLVSAGGFSYSYSVIMAPIGREFEASRFVLTLGFTASLLSYGLISPLLGKALDQYSVRRVMLIGAACSAAGFFLLSMTTAMWQVIAIFAFLFSIAQIALGPMSTTVLISRWFVRKRGMALSLAAIGTSAGGLLFPPMVQGLLEIMEWRSAVFSLGILMLVLLFPPILSFAIDSPSHRDLHPDGDPSGDKTVSWGSAQSGTSGANMRDYRFWFVAFFIGTSFSASSAVIANLIPIALDRGIANEQAVFLLSGMATAGFFGKVLFATIVDRLHVRITIMGTQFVLLLSLYSFTLSGGYGMILLGCIGLGVGAGALLPLWSFLLAKLFGVENVGRVMGLMSFTFMPLNLLSPPLFGWIRDASGSYDFGFFLYAILIVVILLVLPLIRLGYSPKSSIQNLGADN